MPIVPTITGPTVQLVCLLPAITGQTNSFVRLITYNYRTNKRARIKCWDKMARRNDTTMGTRLRDRQ